MNIKLQTYVESFAMLVVLTLLFSLIFSALYYFQWISCSTFHLLNITSAYLIYGCCGLWLGKHIKKKVLLHIFGILLPIGILSFLLWDKQITSMLLITGKLIVFLLCACAIFLRKKD